MNRSFKIFLFVLYAAALGIAIYTVARYIASPLRSDESDFFNQMRAILIYGSPKMPFGESSYLFKNNYYFGYDAYYGMWHPPLFLYAAALIAWVSEPVDIVMRLTGLFCFLAAAWIAWQMTLEHADAKTPRELKPLGIAIILMTPFLMEGSLFVDIDNTVLNLTLVLYFWAYLHFSKLSLKKGVILSVILWLSFCAKLTTPWLALTATGIFEWNRSGFRNSLLFHAGIAVSALVLFLIAYAVYCQILRYPAEFMFEFSFLKRAASITGGQSLESIIHAGRWFFIWISPLISFLFVFAALSRISSFLKSRILEAEDLLFLFSGLSFFVYLFLQAKWGKYAYPSIFLGGIGLGLWLLRAVRNVEIKNGKVLVLLSCAALAAQNFLVYPLQVKPPSSVWRMSLLEMVFEPRNRNLLLAVLLSAAFVLLGRLFFKTRGGEGRWAASMLAAVLIFNPMNQWRLMAAPFERSPFAPHEGAGFRETAAYLNRHISENEILLCPKDLGSYFKGRYYSTDESQSFWDTPVTEIGGMGIKTIVDSTLYPTLIDRESLLKNPNVRLVKKIGEFAVYRVANSTRAHIGKLDTGEQRKTT